MRWSKTVVCEFENYPVQVAARQWRNDTSLRSASVDLISEEAQLYSTREKELVNIGVVIAFLSAMVLSISASAQDQGLHNSSKEFAAPADLSWTDWDDPLELDRTWQAAIVRVPAGKGQSRQVTTDDLLQQTTGIEGKIPTVIYLHGCSGIWPGTHTRIKFLSDNGFLVIAPASLARETYPRSCNVETHEGGLFRGTLVLRHNDAGYAIEKAREVSIVDKKNIVLMGFSEGGLATVTFEARNEQQHVSARVSEGWTCHVPWPEARGVNAPESEPVLTLVGERDPWYQSQWTIGDCAQFLNPTNGSKSVVYRDGVLADKHGLLDHEIAQRDVLEFLNKNLDF
ncbi:MAG: dienelactone hydrolase family protein [Roseibium sp.]|uniref:dienelactone hydrolase family protein n=1 Tax=Roseibium sp. TaxID=1936156 RepID=UPI0026371B6F|nr:dienelactone hydrolase family protein [Roseibium sp.]MCV0425930.1 dienelactone hydrolase family protein [Roseibium sp.]